MEPKSDLQIPEAKPSVGRIVHFAYGETVMPAIVTNVPNDVGTVAVTVFVSPEHQEKAGMHFSTLADYDGDGRPGTWRWPPRA